MLCVHSIIPIISNKDFKKKQIFSGTYFSTAIRDEPLDMHSLHNETHKRQLLKSQNSLLHSHPHPLLKHYFPTKALHLRQHTLVSLEQEPWDLVSPYPSSEQDTMSQLQTTAKKVFKEVYNLLPKPYNLILSKNVFLNHVQTTYLNTTCHTLPTCLTKKLPHSINPYSSSRLHLRTCKSNNLYFKHCTKPSQIHMPCFSQIHPPSILIPSPLPYHPSADTIVQACTSLALHMS
mmetsp:Transcript_9327/g.13244  ORF Transcript_9327/g.13244 Transcript_9327/m.13244 type:complete len:233 (+) Transcript_9327:877-1575(+)